MQSFQEQVEEILQCPCCFNIPREQPISSCSAGHLVCERCRPNITFCPICRGSLMYCTNTVAGKICLLASHYCKYNNGGCLVKLPLPKLEDHERSCDERTVVCAFRGDLKHWCTFTYL